MRPRLVVVAALTATSACLEGTGVAPVVIEAANVVASPHQALAAVVGVVVRDADSVAVRFRPAGAAGAAFDSTPAVPSAAGEANIPVLGLHPERRYLLQVVAHGRGGRTVGEAMELTTGSLPADLPSFSAEGSDPSHGFVLFASGPFLVVIDGAGRVVWYRRAPGGPSLNVMAQPTGRYVTRPSAPAGGATQGWFELDAEGNVTRTLGCARGLSPRLHDLIAQRDGSHWILCDETRTMDLRSLGGRASAQVTGTVVQHVGADGALVFEWSAFDHLSLADLPPGELSGASVNWTHGNAIDLDVDGNLLVSFRSLNEITKIDARTGAVLWRMGGRANQFTFAGAEPPPFARQHGLRASGPGEIVLLDNRGDPARSSAERWAVDGAARAARLVRSYASSPGVITDIGGSVQPLPGGRLLVSFGTAGRVEEYDASGALVWRMLGNPGYVFRAQRIASLYAPGAGTPR